MSLVFLQAFHAKQSGEISWDDYIHNIVIARCAGVKQANFWPLSNKDVELSKVDPFGHSILCWNDKVEQVKDASALEAVFTAYCYSTLDDLQEYYGLLKGLEDGDVVAGVKQSLALLALQERRNDVLKFCLDHGPFSDMGRSFQRQADRVDSDKDPETWDILEKSVFRQIYPRGPMVTGKIGAGPGTPAVFDLGGRLPVNW